nr:MAG TPA: hypothetical protein [Caudoviricetes sp.]
MSGRAWGLGARIANGAGGRIAPCSTIISVSVVPEAVTHWGI